MLSQNKLSTCSYALNNFSKCIMINGGKCNFLVYSSCHHAHKKSTFIHSVFIYATLFPFMTLIYEKIIIRETSLTFITVQVFFSWSVVYIDHFAPSFLTNVFSITLAYYILYLTLKLNGHGYFLGLWKMRTKKNQ